MRCLVIDPASLWAVKGKLHLSPFSPAAHHGSLPLLVEGRLWDPDHKGRTDTNTWTHGECGSVQLNVLQSKENECDSRIRLTSKCRMNGAMPLYGWLWCFSWGNFSSWGRKGIGSRGAKRASRFGGKNCVIFHLHKQYDLSLLSESEYYQ